MIIIALGLLFSFSLYAGSVVTKKDLENEVKTISKKTVFREDCVKNIAKAYDLASRNGIKVTEKHMEESVSQCFSAIASREAKKLKADNAKLHKLGLFPTSEDLADVKMFKADQWTNLAQVNKACLLMSIASENSSGYYTYLLNERRLNEKKSGGTPAKDFKDILKFLNSNDMSSDSAIEKGCMQVVNNVVLPAVKRKLLDPSLLNNKTLECVTSCKDRVKEQLSFLKDKRNWKVK